MHDEAIMRRCLELARLAEGRTSPNPIVGCVVVDKDNNFIAEGFHRKHGEVHAEVEALDKAGEKARGGTLFVNLEPCSHFGKQPPCADRIIASGIAKVVAAIGDPNPKVAGKGFKKLEDAGIKVVRDVLSLEAKLFNKPFLKAKTQGLPWVVLKIAATLDGHIADRDGKSKWITGDQARLLVMNLRNKADAVIIGAGTARADNPKLSVRGLPANDSRDPVRVVIDPKLSVQKESNLFLKETGGRTIVYCSNDATCNHTLGDHVKIKKTPGKSKNAIDPELDLTWILKDLVEEEGINNVLCEGGGILAGNLLQENLVDDIYWFVAPKILGDSKAKLAVEGQNAIPLGKAKAFELNAPQIIGMDLLLLLHNPESMAKLLG
ncbi:MAG: bifunctional diaminohydroxyphosphoribosylaminopyrimidine deaminase/5-amino-6-(5-phosphoribosylamino)uracil reductase RibD [Candidatus Melainabacteria bacterium]|nr:bifunctional diaminohydroxyphosphoribosylaminopyrimidine deaminase/5-amino-6-(5-phosphoribosylamino)uracil reductase RibD [Candidatus Melainabacteria bacterium]